jgi:hypothetical protein
MLMLKNLYSIVKSDRNVGRRTWKGNGGEGNRGWLRVEAGTRPEGGVVRNLML